MLCCVAAYVPPLPVLDSCFWFSSWPVPGVLARGPVNCFLVKPRKSQCDWSQVSTSGSPPGWRRGPFQMGRQIGFFCSCLNPYMVRCQMAASGSLHGLCQWHLLRGSVNCFLVPLPKYENVQNLSSHFWFSSRPAPGALRMKEGKLHSCVSA